MPHTIDTELSDVRGKRFAVVCARFNELVVEQLLKGCLDELRHFGVADEHITVAWTPGAFEIPLIARKLAGRAEFAAVICLGAVIRGDTAHFDYVASEAAKGVAQAAWQCDKPVIFGVLTTNSLEQALERAGSKGGNKGREAARSALEMAALFDALKQG